jgi:hypothetical protein
VRRPQAAAKGEVASLDATLAEGDALPTDTPVRTACSPARERVHRQRAAAIPYPSPCTDTRCRGGLDTHRGNGGQPVRNANQATASGLPFTNSARSIGVYASGSTKPPG